MEKSAVNPQTPPQNPEIFSHQPRNIWLIPEAVVGAVILGLIIVCGIGFYLLSKNKNTRIAVLPKSQALLPTSTPTPVLFREMTVPYLRARSYKSKLGTREQTYTGVNYTAYLTSYDSDGLKINALLTIPTGTAPKDGWPAVVFVHGYIPPTQYETNGQAYSSYVDYIAQNGLVVFKIDLRGHGNSQGTPGGGYFGSDYIVDTLNAYSALQSADFVNSKKVGMWGHSMAGNILMRSLVVHPDIRATVIWAGAVYSYVDQQKYGIQDASYRPPQFDKERQRKRQELFDRYGQPSSTSAFWKQVAPVNYLQDIKGAIEINHAEDDETVNIGYSQDLVALLDKTSVHHEFYEYSTGGHNITGVSFNAAMQHTVEFFKKYL